MSTTETKHWTMDDIKQACPLWFSKGTMRFFRSRVGDYAYNGPGGVFFVSSEQFEDSSGNRDRRMYSVRRFDPETMDISTASAFQEYATGATANRHAKLMAEGEETPRENSS